MKILNLCFHDTAGSAYCLSHAINKYTGHQSINLRSTSNYVEYPTIAEMRHYNQATCQKMVYGSDAIIFHSAIRPFYQGLELDPQRLEDKKKLLYFHGSDLRFTGRELLEQAKEYLGDYQVLVSTPDLLLYLPTAKWLPVARSFAEIRRRYALCNQDTRALNKFGGSAKKTVFCHAPTDEAKKGSDLIYKVITAIVKLRPEVQFMTIRNQSWSVCLRKLSEVDVYFGQNPPFVGSYGMLAVEAAAFKIPTITKLTRQVIDIIKKEVGLDNPFATFQNEEELFDRAILLVENLQLRKKMGELAYRYCKAVHDEKPVVNRIFEILGEMA